LGAASEATAAPAALERAVYRTQARDALVGLGWQAGIARQAVDGACHAVGGQATLEQLIIEALRRCPRPITATAHAPQAP
jgi:Holliday junction resolvasome RuvABC DNA-binding subunit